MLGFFLAVWRALLSPPDPPPPAPGPVSPALIHEEETQRRIGYLFMRWQAGHPLLQHGIAERLALAIRTETRPEADDLAAQQREAQDLSERFVAWRDRVERGGIVSLRAVARSFHRAARLLEIDPPKTLIDILVGPAGAEPAELEEVTL